MIGQQVSPLVFPNQIEEVSQYAQRVLRNIDVPPWSGFGVHKAGHTVHLSFRAWPVRNSVGEVSAVSLLIRDESIRREVEETRALLASIVESSDDAISSTDLNGTIISWNHQCELLYGCSRQEAVGKYLPLCAPSFSPSEFEMILKVVSEGGTITPFESVVERQDGTLSSVSIRVSPIRNQKNQVIGSSAIFRDITEQKRSDAAVRETEKKYKEIFEGALEGIFQASPDARFLTANSFLAKMLGYESAEEILSAVRDVTRDVWADPAEFEQFSKLLSTQGSIQDFECHFRRKDGSLVCCSLTCRNICRADGHLLYTEGFVEDVTERKQAEMALCESRDSLVEAQTIGGLGSYSLNMKTGFWTSSKVLDEIFGIDEVYPRTVEGWKALIHVDDQEMMAEYFAKDVLEAKRGFEKEYRIVRQNDQTERWVQGAGKLDFDSNGMPVKMSGVIKDITERKHGEIQLRESEERFSTLSNAAIEGILIHREGIIQDANMACARQFGYDDPHELIGLFGPDLMVAPESRERLIQRIEAKETGVTELTGRRKDGSTFVGEVESKKIRYRGQDATLVSTRDVTERRRAEEERKTLQAQLFHAHKMESIGRLTGSIAHDFNNLLTVIIGSSELLLHRLPESDPLWESINEINGAGQRAAGLTQQLLVFSRKQVLQPRVLDLNKLVKEMQPLLKRLVGGRVSIAVELQAGPIRIYADPLQLDSVIMNLVVNARDAMPEGGHVHIGTSIEEFDAVQTRTQTGGRTGAFAKLIVGDTGVGIDEEIQNRIFEPFFTTKNPGEGTGLGLAVTQGIIEQSGGSIEVQSEPGNGSTFSVYLPLIKDALIEADEQKLLPGWKGAATILVAEDQVEFRKFAVAALRSYGYSVIEAENPDKVLGLCNRERGQVDLILTDVVMPTLSGRAMASMVRHRWPQIKMLFMSGYSDDAGLHQGILEKNSGFIQRPFSGEELVTKVQDMLVGTSSI